MKMNVILRIIHKILSRFKLVLLSRLHTVLICYVVPYNYFYFTFLKHKLLLMLDYNIFLFLFSFVSSKKFIISSIRIAGLFKGHLPFHGCYVRCRSLGQTRIGGIQVAIERYRQVESKLIIQINL
jgi:hypothetical protein